MTDEPKKHFITRFFDRVFNLARLKSFGFEISLLKGFSVKTEFFEDKKEDGKQDG